MQVTPEMRASFDKVAVGAVVAAQKMLRANPTLNPTDAYRLAFAFALEQYVMLMVTSYQVQLDQALSLMQLLKKKDNQ